MLKITLGTTSNQKWGYVKEILNQLEIECEIIPVDVESGVSSQPLTEDETLNGSLNRARKAFESDKSVDFGLGIEVGYHPNKNNILGMFCCTSIVSSNGFETSCISSKLPLPKFHRDIIAKNQNLGDFVREFKKEDSQKHVGLIRDMIIHRKELITEATRNALLNFLLKEDY